MIYTQENIYFVGKETLCGHIKVLDLNINIIIFTYMHRLLLADCGNKILDPGFSNVRDELKHTQANLKKLMNSSCLPYFT